ncbi:MAG: hypothetical protein IPM14_00180 [bacterium]|nr:hypothetical protein [bacterium]
MKILLLAFIFILASINSLSQVGSQVFKEAYPVIGWDSLKTIIEKPENYPEKLRRAGITGNLFLSLLIDTTGTLVQVEPAFGYKSVAKLDSLKYYHLILQVEKILIPIQWIPCYLDDKPITQKIYRSFNFIMIDEIDKGFNILAPKIYFEKSH